MYSTLTSLQRNRISLAASIVGRGDPGAAARLESDSVKGGFRARLAKLEARVFNRSVSICATGVTLIEPLTFSGAYDRGRPEIVD